MAGARNVEPLKSPTRVARPHPGVAWGVFILLLATGLFLHARWVLQDAVGQLPLNLDGGLAVTEADITSWEAVRRSHAMMLARLFAEPSGSAMSKERYAPFLDAVAVAEGYDAIWVTSERGELLAHAGNAALAPNVSFRALPTLHDTVMIETAAGRMTSGVSPALDFIAVTRSDPGTGSRSVRVVLRSRASDSTFRNLNPTSAANRTARTSLVVRMGDSAFIIATRSHQQQPSALPRTLAVRTLPPHVRAALDGGRVLGTGRGLFGAEVAFAARPALAAGWALVREMERSEYEDRFRASIAIQAVVLGALALLVAYAVTNRARAAAAYRARELARLQTDFVASASHELRTPLAQIQLFSELLRSGALPSAADTDRALSVIASESQRLATLVDNLLNFASLRRQRGLGGHEQCNLAVEAEQVLTDFRMMANAHAVELRARLEPEVTAQVGPDAFRQVLINFLDNAVKYGPQGQSITVRVWQTARTANLSVEDEGPGVPFTQRQRIWQPFYRHEDPSGTATPGSGIGLAVVRDLVMQAGGAVRVEDAVRGGATFLAEFPRVVPDGPPHGTERNLQ